MHGQQQFSTEDHIRPYFNMYILSFSVIVIVELRSPFQALGEERSGTEFVEFLLQSNQLLPLLCNDSDKGGDFLDLSWKEDELQVAVLDLLLGHLSHRVFGLDVGNGGYGIEVHGVYIHGVHRSSCKQVK